MDFRLIPVAFWYVLLFVVLYLSVILFDINIFSTPSVPSEADVGFSSAVFKRLVAGFSLAMLFFLLLRPRVSISNLICKDIDKKTGEEFYTFKFINNSLFSAFDVNVEAYICSKTNATLNDNGVNVKLDKIDLTRNKWIYIAKWKPIFKNTEYAHHCTTVRTFKKDIDKLIKENSAYLEFRITLKHAFSNLSSTYRVRYMSDGCIKQGKFIFGNSLKITNLNKNH